MKVVSGMRPTGRLHLGNYWGALRNWVDLQSKFKGQCVFFVADWHALTTGYEKTEGIRADTREMVLDWLAAGLDPGSCVIFQQSMVPEHAELALLFSMMTPLGWLLRNPTYKEQLQELYGRRFAGQAGAPAAAPSMPYFSATTSAQMARALAEVPADDASQQMADINTHGFVGYPVLQAADVLIYKGESVPVGQDQVPHLELTRDIARRFNALYGEVFPEPQPLLTPTPKVPGLDGRKMSKSYGNTIELSEAADALQKKAMAMYTDAMKVRKADKGHPEPCPENPPGCVVFAMHKLYNAGAVPVVERECRDGLRGCVDCKKELLKPMEEAIASMRERRARFSAREADEILREGSRKAREIAARTLDEVREAMHLS